MNADSVTPIKMAQQEMKISSPLQINDNDKTVADASLPKSDAFEIKNEPNTEITTEEIKVKINDNDKTVADAEADAIKNELNAEITTEKIKVESLARAVSPIQPLRMSCSLGIKCSGKNRLHRIYMAHPDDSDYRRPAFPEPIPGAPACYFGASCYRRNPHHFLKYSHHSDNIYIQTAIKRKTNKRHLCCLLMHT